MDQKRLEIHVYHMVHVYHCTHVYVHVCTMVHVYVPWYSSTYKYNIAITLSQKRQALRCNGDTTIGSGVHGETIAIPWYQWYVPGTYSSAQPGRPPVAGADDH